jgi:hypothetical protein
MSSAAGFRARTLAMQEAAQDSLELGPDFGASSVASWIKSNRSTQSSRMSRPFALEDWARCCKTSARSGLMRNGTVYPLPPLAPLMRETVSGLLPTPRACDGSKGSGQRSSGGGSYGLGNWIARRLGLPMKTTTKFDPELSELLMGFPVGWSALTHSETPSSRRSRKSSGER